ncbi:helix-turn-helix domain-containing protein [Pseudonocardia sp. WMMC193]|uniref:helix-turn-helix domain-containing protein n=1 Tax=Pseudonocardia sp. WMMC193 TaxID=2911965 RepID=UPI001F3B70E1|nr:helix-turn-helix domain-containing protein [Pseudonocardia sp. WMMC193]MCF7552099.1 helix-turn-helix domain-containing protein [Pseudonocardia sp. WMMC193]
MEVQRSVTATPRLSASWRRSEDYGIPLDAVNPAFSGGVDSAVDGSLFYECGQEILGGLRDTLSGEPVSMMLTDADGLVLSRVCDESALVSALDKTYLAPGFAFSEREAGTNGLGLALADRAPSLVRGEEHYCTGLWGYTCAAAPVMDPVFGRLLGSVNLTTWSEKSAGLLLALAQTAAGHTSTLMLARGRGAQARPTPKGEVFRVFTAQRDTATPPALGEAWESALAETVAALRTGRTVGVIGEAGVGKTALLAAALRRVHRDHRILNARPPDPRDADSWLALWTPELAKDRTSVIAGGVDALPLWAASELATIVGDARGASLAVTASEAAGIPRPLSRLLDTVVSLPPLRQRPDDVLPLAEYFGEVVRGRAVRFTPAAARALRTFAWPGNAEQLRRVVREAVTRGDVIDVHHLAPEVLCGSSRTLTRIETLERDEIARALAEPGITVTQAAKNLGMSRATIYRKITQYGIRPE